MTVKLKPSAAKPLVPVKKSGVDGSDEEELRSSMTVKLKPVAAKAPKKSADEENSEDDRTVRIQRPALKKPAGGQGVNPAANRPAGKRPAGNRPEADVDMPAAPAQMPVARPSGFYMIMTLISLLFLIGTAALTTVHYLNFEHKIEVEIPGIPFGK